MRLPTPNSWYAVAFSDELKPGSVVTRQLAGEDVVLYRTQSGIASAVSAFCPHLGAHFGYGGTVQGDDLRCPFHGFEYNLDGMCVKTGYGTKPPPSARLKRYALAENNGILFVWYDSQDCPPTWDPPGFDEAGWTKLRYRTLRLKDHPQETVENSVDIGHFGIVHGYTDIETHKDILIDGPFFHTKYAASRPMPIVGKPFKLSVRFEFDISIHGLGYSLVRVYIPQYDMTLRFFILATPLDDTHIHLHLCLSVKKLASGASIHPLLGFLPGGWLSHLTARIVHGSLIHDVMQDVPIWENKRFMQRPALAEGDGPIGKFRQWTRQFYHTLPTADV